MVAAWLSSAASVAVALVLVALTVLGPLVAIDRWTTERSWEHRVLAVTVSVVWHMVAVFEALTSAHAFTLGHALAAELVLCAIALKISRPGLAGRVARDGQALLDSVLRAGVVTRLALAVAGGLCVVTALRGLVLPPLGWDALTYHLYHAARWIQTGARPIDLGPGAWGYYAYFPYVGDVPWAWMMLPFRGDEWVSLPAAACLPAIAIVTFALARDLGAEDDGAWLAAVFVVMCPAVLGYAETAYVDNLLLFLWAVGSLFLGRYWSGAAQIDLVLSLTALGLAAGVKPSGVPLFAAGAVWVGARALSRRHAVALAIGVCMGALCLRTYAVAWLAHGSPLWPLAMPGNPGDPEIVALLTTHDTVALGAAARLAFLFLLREPVSHYFLNLGPLVAVLAAIALIEIPRTWVREDAPRALLAWLIASTVVVVALVLKTQPTDWMFAIGRLLSPLLVTVAVIAARRLRSSWLSYALLLIAIPYAWPRGIRATEGPLLALAAGSAAVVAVLWVARRPVLGGVAGFVALAALARVHATDRFDFYDASRAPRPLYTAHPIDRELVLPEIWARLDEGPSYRVGYAAGWDGTGHNWLLYPVLGSRLQNTVHWVSPTGSDVSYRLTEDLERSMDRAAWLREIQTLDLDWFLAAAPAPPETRWLEPPCFQPEARSGEAVLFRIDQSCVEDW